ncbi:MAG: hypothetical protein QM737_09485 [Ferruginibacter sp.]
MKNSTLSLTETISGNNAETQQANTNITGTTTKSSPIRNIILLIIYLGTLVYILDYFA